MIYPSKEEIETELGRNSNYLDGIATLFKKYALKGWEPAYTKLKEQLADYDAWVRENILPRARTDFRLPPQKYALEFERYGIDIAAGADRGDGACRLRAIPGRDGAARRAGRQGERLPVRATTAR